MHGCIEELGFNEEKVLLLRIAERNYSCISLQEWERRIIMMLMIMMCPVEAWKNEKKYHIQKDQ